MVHPLDDGQDPLDDGQEAGINVKTKLIINDTTKKKKNVNYHME